MDSKRVLVIGGDGFCGWPLCLRLSKLGHEVMIIDNFYRRSLDKVIGESLTPIKPLDIRLETWYNLTGKNIQFRNIDVTKEYDELKKVLTDFHPTTVVHLAEQKSAGYSMKNSDTKRFTVTNNLTATNNILCAINEVDPDIHIVHIGTMGVYGYGTIPDSVIPEGYVTVEMNHKPVRIMHPAYGGSIYHVTKTQDALLFQFYAKNDRLKITDLHQGIVWGVNTKETELHPDLINRLDYDSDYGTVFNRFVVQGVCDYPLTVYGSGEQTRGFININNSVECLVLAIENPPSRGDEVKIFNQLTETRKLLDLAFLVKEQSPNVEISYIENPRKELAENDLKVENGQFLGLGMKPITFSSETVKPIFELASKYKQSISKEMVYPTSFW